MKKYVYLQHDAKVVVIREYEMTEGPPGLWSGENVTLPERDVFDTPEEAVEAQLDNLRGEILRILTAHKSLEVRRAELDRLENADIVVRRRE